jgi:hypothetical protein
VLQGIGDVRGYGTTGAFWMRDHHETPVCSFDTESVFIVRENEATYGASAWRVVWVADAVGDDCPVLHSWWAATMPRIAPFA